MHLRSHIEPHIYYSKGLSYLPVSIQEQLAQKAEQFFTNLGWKVRTRKGRKDNQKDFKFTAQKDHVSIRYKIAPLSPVTIHYRTEGGGTAPDHSWDNWSTNLQEAVDHAGKIRPVKRISKENLPKPFDFKDKPLKAKRHRQFGTVSVHRECQIIRVNVISIVALDDKGVISKDQVMVPGEVPYFYLGCSAPSGATFNLITDGEIAYAVKRYNKQRVTSEPHPKATVDLNKLSSQDKELMQMAIAGYLNQDDLEWI
jgi:hypothetical protein